MARRLGRQIGDRRDNFSRQSFFLLAMATKTVAAWSAAIVLILDVRRTKPPLLHVISKRYKDHPGHLYFWAMPPPPVDQCLN